MLVSAGTVEANRAHGFRSPLLLVQSFVAGRALGVSGTPSALLVDAEGEIASASASARRQSSNLAASRA